MSNKFDILTFGSITLDTFIKPKEVNIFDKNGTKVFAYPVGHKIQIETIAKYVGGGSANVSVGFATLGLKAACLGVVGDDENGHLIAHRLVKKNVDIDYLQIEKDGFSSSSIIFMLDEGRRTVFHERTLLADYSLFPSKIPTTKAIYVGHLATEEEGLFNNIKKWKKQNNIFAWNPGKTQYAQGFDAFEEIYPHCDLLVLNKEEAEAFAGLKSEKTWIENSGAKVLWKNDDIVKIYDFRKIAKKFIEKGIKNLIITDGSNGAQAFNKDNHLFAPLAQSNLKVISTLGAGDAFSVGAVSAMLYGLSLEEMLKWGSLNSASVITIFGAQRGLLTKKEMDVRAKKLINHNN